MKQERRDMLRYDINTHCSVGYRDEIFFEHCKYGNGSVLFL